MWLKIHRHINLCIVIVVCGCHAGTTQDDSKKKKQCHTTSNGHDHPTEFKSQSFGSEVIMT